MLDCDKLFANIWEKYNCSHLDTTLYKKRKVVHL